MNYDLVIFDCDGTLVDSEPVTMRLITKMMKEMGIESDTESNLARFAGKNIFFITEWMEEMIGSFDKAEFERDYRERCLQVFDDELEAVPGVIELIQSLTVPYCIASNGPMEKMDVTLRVTNIMELFSRDHIFSAYDLQKWKPDPALYLHVTEVMGATKDKAVVIEDTLPGLMGAVNAGIDVIAYNPHHKTELHVDGVPNYEHMDQIREHLHTAR